LERWLTQANPAGGAAGVNSSSASTSTEREIAAAWRRTQRELFAAKPHGLAFACAALVT